MPRLLKRSKCPRQNARRQIRLYAGLPGAQKASHLDDGLVLVAAMLTSSSVTWGRDKGAQLVNLRQPVPGCGVKDWGPHAVLRER